MKADKFNRLTDILGYSFQDRSLLERALTHRSVGNRHNETLEFLGDSVLSTIVSSHLYREFPDASEGELTVRRSGVVNNSQALYRVAEHMAFRDFIIVDKSFTKSNEKAWQNLMANTVEALIGAIYLEGGIEKATEFFDRHFTPLLDELKTSAHTNFKSLLQEYLQRRAHDIPRYETVEVRGQNHKPEFTVQCHIDSLTEPVIGTGKTVKEAEQVAAGRAYELLCRPSC